MKKILFFFVALFVLASCENEDKGSTMPSFYGFKVTCDNENGGQPSVGDIITVTAVQKSLGNLIYNARYIWTVSTTINGEPFSKQFDTKYVVYDYDKSNPTFKYIVPAGNNGRITVNFVAEYDFSAKLKHMDNSSTNADGYVGSITTMASNIVGRASGSCSINVNP